MMKTARLIAPGMGVSFQDSGRPGWARFGVPPGGAMDITSMTQANQLVGNRPHDPVLEILMQGADLEFLAETWVAVTGGEAGASIPSGTAFPVAVGTRLRFSRLRKGVWIYVAVAGGWRADRWFDSASTHPRAGLGKGLSADTILHATPPALSSIPRAVAARRIRPDTSKPTTPLLFPVYPGVQYEDFSRDARSAFEETVWTVSPESDRTGYRLEGPALSGGPEIVSEPLTPGTIQIPGNGKPIVTMPDGPTVGGYPKLAWLPPEARSKLAQSPPGSQIQFKWISPSSMPTSAKAKPPRPRKN